MSAAPVVNAEYMAEIEKARRDLRALIASKSCAPIMLRLACVVILFFLDFAVLVSFRPEYLILISD